MKLWPFSKSELTDTQIPTTLHMSEPLSVEPPQKQRSRRKKIITIVLIVIGTLMMILPVLWYVAFYVSLSGGIHQTYLDHKATSDAHSTEISAKRAVTKASLNNDFDQIESLTKLKNYGAAYHDVCYRGQHNFEVQDPYANRCAYQVTRYYGFSGDFKTTLLSLHNALTTSGWTASVFSIPRVINEYYDQYTHTTDPTILKNFGGKYLVSDLPGSYYRKTNASNTQNLEVNYAQKDTTNFLMLDYQQNYAASTSDVTYEDKHFVVTKPLFAKILAENDYFIGISINQIYFQN